MGILKMNKAVYLFLVILALTVIQFRFLRGARQ